MSKDLNLIAAIVGQRDFLRTQDLGVKAEHIEGQVESEIYKFIFEYHEQYRETPSAAVILDKYDVSLPNVEEGLDYWIAEIKRRTLHSHLQELFLSFTQKFNNDDPEGSYSLIREFVKKQETELTSELQMIDVEDLKEVVVNRYNDAKAGKKGITTPWFILDSWTNGWHPKDLSFVIARSGVGKTFFMICLAISAIKQGKKVLFISCEMSSDDIASRFYAMWFKKQYSAMRKGRLSYFEEEQIMSEISGYKGGNLKIMDG
jgi:replicative DNA helicase